MNESPQPVGSQKNYQLLRMLTFALTLYPITDLLVSPISSVSTGTILLLVTIAALALFDRSVKLHVTLLSSFMFYCFTITIINLCFGGYIYPESGAKQVLLRMLRFVLVLWPLISLNLFEIIDQNLTFKIIRGVAVVTSLFTILQFIALSFGVHIPNALAGLSARSFYTVENSSYLSSAFRPSGLFFEPAHMAQYCLAYLIWQLFDATKSNHRILFSSIIVTGIFASGSGMGIAFSMIILYIYLLYRSRSNIFALSLFALLLVVFIAFINSDYGKTIFINRLFTDNIAGGGNAITARVGKGYSFFLNKELIDRIFGSGFGNVPSWIYLNGIEYILNTLGILGLIWFILSTFIDNRKMSFWGYMVMILYFSILSFAQAFSPSTLTFNLLIMSSAASQNLEKPLLSETVDAL